MKHMRLSFESAAYHRNVVTFAHSCAIVNISYYNAILLTNIEVLSGWTSAYGVKACFLRYNTETHYI